MAVTPYIFDGAQLTGAAVTQGTVVPALTKRIIKAATLTNTTGAPVAATVYMVPEGHAAGADNTVVPTRAIAPGESYPCPEMINQGLNAGGFIQAAGNGLTFKYTATDFV